MVVAGIAFAIICIDIIEKLMPGWEGFFTWENMVEMAIDEKGYTNNGDLNRFTALRILNERIFHSGTNWFGIGIGNAEYSDTYTFLNSAFYHRYRELNYGWFSIAKVYIELGYFGILSMVCIWIQSAVVGIKGAIKNLEYDKIYCKMAVVIAVLIPMLFIYNATMHMETACLICFCMALGYIVTKDMSNIDDEEMLKIHSKRHRKRFKRLFNKGRKL